MPVFTLTKYAADKAVQDQPKEGGSAEDQKEKEEEMITISASDTVSKVIAKALHKYLKHTYESDGQEADTAVISTEEINSNPVHSYNRAKAAKQVVILNRGFKTQKEDWLLSTLQYQNKPVFYSIESYLKTLGKKEVSV